MLCPLHKSSQILNVDENGEEVKIFVSPKAQGRRFHLLDNWGSNKKITRVPNSGILPRHYTRPADQSNCSAEAKKLLCRHATLLHYHWANISDTRKFSFVKLANSSQRHRPAMWTFFGQWHRGWSGRAQANKQTGTILISPPRDIPLPSSLGDCHAQVEPACIIAQSRRQYLVSSQCMSTKILTSTQEVPGT